MLAFLCPAIFEPHSISVLKKLEAIDWFYLLLIGLGALGGAFYAWDAALKNGDAQRIGVLAFLTPILSTFMLSLTQGHAPHWSTWLAVLMIVLASWLGSRSN